MSIIIVSLKRKNIYLEFYFCQKNENPVEGGKENKKKSAKEDKPKGEKIDTKKGNKNEGGKEEAKKAPEPKVEEIVKAPQEAVKTPEEIKSEIPAVKQTSSEILDHPKILKTKELVSTLSKDWKKVSEENIKR